MTIRLRPATISDAEMLFRWVNQPDSLAGKRHTAVAIPWDTHVAWLTGQLENPAGRLWVIEKDGTAVGQVRLSPDRSGRRLIDIYVVGPARRGGLAAAALRLALQQATVFWPLQPVYAEVLAENQPSHRLFRHLGFSRLADDGVATVYEITPQRGEN